MLENEGAEKASAVAVAACNPNGTGVVTTCSQGSFHGIAALAQVVGAELTCQLHLIRRGRRHSFDETMDTTRQLVGTRVFQLPSNGAPTGHDRLPSSLKSLAAAIKAA